MNMLSVTSAATVAAKQVTPQQTQATTKANGAAPFQQQLNQYVNQTSSGNAAITNEGTVEAQVVVEEVQAESLSLNVDELVALVEQLIEKIEELIDAPITDEDKDALDEMSMQLLAILQLLTVDNQSSNEFMDQLTQLNSALNTQTTELQAHNPLLYKLQDQLLMLQQTLTEGNFKVIQGQQPEQVVAQFVSKLNQLVDTVKEHSKGQLIQQLTEQADQQDSEISVEELPNKSLEQLKQLTKQAEYVQLANQTTSSTDSNVKHVAAQHVESTPVTHLQGSVPFSAQLSETVSATKGQFQTPTHSTIPQFAETVKSIVVQKFDLAQLTNGITQARITLNPENLGSVDIKLSMQNGVLTAIFSAETAMAKDALENQMSVLRGSLAAQGISVERMEVTQASFSEELEWQQRRQNQANAESEHEEENDESFEAELEAKVLGQELGFGRAVNETI